MKHASQLFALQSYRALAETLKCEKHLSSPEPLSVSSSAEPRLSKFERLDDPRETTTRERFVRLKRNKCEN